jgi:hypothetical protein
LSNAGDRASAPIIIYQGTPLNDAQADHAILQMYRQDVIGVQRSADVVREWENALAATVTIAVDTAASPPFSNATTRRLGLPVATCSASVAEKTSYTPQNVGRRLRELENEGVVEVRYEEPRLFTDVQRRSTRATYQSNQLISPNNPITAIATPHSHRSGSGPA